MDLGRTNTRTAARRAAGGTLTGKVGTVRVRQQYAVCPMCSKRASVRETYQGERAWRCLNCGYRDTEHGPLN